MSPMQTSATMAPETQGPPYPSRSAGMGGLPAVSEDVPISAVFLAIYLGFAIFNQVTFQLNRRRGHKFLIQWAVFGFCMVRILTFTLRIVWSVKQHNVRLAIVAQIFINAGIIIVYIVNYLFALRIFRARQPELGWSRILHFGSVAFYWMMGLATCLVISMVVLTSFTLDLNLLKTAKDILLAGLTIYTIFAYMGPVLLITTVALPVSPKAEHFGKGDMSKKIMICAISCAIAVFDATFRCATSWQAPRPISNPAWYQSKPAFYCIEIVPEIFVLALYAVSEIHLRFHVPNGSSKVRSYAVAEEKASVRSNSTSSQETDVEKAEL